MTVLSPRAALTRADLQTLPVDGLRYELLDGSLIVTPAPSLLHQGAVARLNRLLTASCPGNLFVLTAPTDVNLADDTVLQPDLLVLERRAVSDDDKLFRPRLAVEVLSPSTRHIDLTLKKARYEAAGTPSYWVVDMDESSVTAWELVDGRYSEPIVVLGAEVLRTSKPFAVAISPDDLRV